MKVDYRIFGCKVNKYYLSRWLNYFKSHNFDISNKVIISTCVVTDRAKSKWLKEAKSELNTGKQVLLTGCGNLEKGGIIDYDHFYKIYPELKVFQNNLTLLPEDPKDANEIFGIGEYEMNHDFDDQTVNEQLYTKKFIVVQNGCDTHCTFCLTIVKRGSNRSRTLEEIISEINDFEGKGGKEIVITGINLAAWGSSNTRKPEENKFSYLLEQILIQTKISRIRISSIGPEFIDDKFFEIVSNPRFLPHFHFSIQSFSDNVLKLMNRNYDSTVLDYVLTKIRNLDRLDRDFISIGADIIVGFPGETEDDFQETYKGISKYGITKLHAFPFSAHQKGETIAASKFPYQISKEIKKQRELILLEYGEKIRNEFIEKNKGQKFRAMLEDQKFGKWTGWTGNYININVEGKYKRGDIVEVEI